MRRKRSWDKTVERLAKREAWNQAQLRRAAARLEKVEQAKAANAYPKYLTT